MRIAVHLGVKDEIELIERCVTHLRSIGVSQFVVCDMYSTDGTAEALEGWKSSDFKIVNISNSEADDRWLALNKEAISDIDCDWLLFLDADEFPLPREGSLQRALESVDVDLIEMPRYNVPLTETGPRLPEALTPAAYGEVDLIVKPIDGFRQVLQRDPTLPWIRAVPLPKIAVRPSVIGQLVQGCHDIVAREGETIDRLRTNDIVVAHLPISTEDRFRCKIENIREFFAHHDAYAGSGMAWHWRRWLQLADRGEIEQEFQRSIYTPQELEELRRAQIISSAAALFSEVN